MISAVSFHSDKTPHKFNLRYANIKYSGYTALGAIGVCALTGFKQVKIPHKMALHKCSAIITALSSLWHLGAIKRWDKFFTKQNSGK